MLYQRLAFLCFRGVQIHALSGRGSGNPKLSYDNGPDLSLPYSSSPRWLSGGRQLRTELRALSKSLDKLIQTS